MHNSGQIQNISVYIYICMENPQVIFFLTTCMWSNMSHHLFQVLDKFQNGQHGQTMDGKNEKKENPLVLPDEKTFPSKIKTILVGGLEHDFFFPIYWECHHPN